MLSGESTHRRTQPGAEKQASLIETHHSPAIGRRADIGKHDICRRGVHCRTDTLDKAKTHKNPVMARQPTAKRAGSQYEETDNRNEAPPQAIGQPPGRNINDQSRHAEDGDEQPDHGDINPKGAGILRKYGTYQPHPHHHKHHLDTEDGKRCVLSERLQFPHHLFVCLINRTSNIGVL